MSQRAGPSFVPFEPASIPSEKPGGARFTPTVIAATDGAAAAKATSSPASSHQHTGATTNDKPVITLQREGDKITSIRIECPCGQIVDLACSY